VNSPIRTLFSKIKFFAVNRSGVAAIEFAIIGGLFFMMVFFIVEMSRIAYISGVLDLAASEGAKMSKNHDGGERDGYIKKFSEALYGGSAGALWRNLIKQDDIQLDISFVSCDRTDCVGNTTATLNKEVNSRPSGDSRNAPIAIYRIAYQYTPMFFPFPGNVFNGLLVREVVFVQEYERSDFMF
jgi:tight adherence protein E